MVYAQQRGYCVEQMRIQSCGYGDDDSQRSVGCKLFVAYQRGFMYDGLSIESDLLQLFRTYRGVQFGEN